ncbi:hypothetical protein HYU13_02985 [Candidatus Woesearchaeota archaeon]|nr:hypothetical protein [Candidatus Woesearchaeota archaeon]
MSEAFTISREKKKPWFRRQDIHKKRIKEKWRKPKGIHSKVRMKKRGYQAVVSIGYGTGSHSWKDEKGLLIRKVCSIRDILSMDGKRECALLSGTVGMKKRLALLKEGKQKGISFRGIDGEEEIKIRA